jgi:hypothetical protein
VRRPGHSEYDAERLAASVIPGQHDFHIRRTEPQRQIIDFSSLPFFYWQAGQPLVFLRQNGEALPRSKSPDIPKRQRFHDAWSIFVFAVLPS